jgi:voltage-gated potassium channel
VPRETISGFLKVLYRERVVALFLAVAFLVLLGALGFSLFEKEMGGWYQRFGRGIWWAIVTLTTVGYGDVVPTTPGGRLVGAGLMLGGLICLALLTATVASIFVERKFRRERGLEAVKSSQHILLLGWHYDAETLLDQLLRRLSPTIPVVLVNQLPPEQLDTLKEKYPQNEINYIWGDFSREEVLQKANVGKASRAVILADRPPGETAAQVDQRTLLTALTLKSLNPKIRMMAELLGPENRSHLERAGAEDVLIRGQYDSSLMAGAIASPGLFRIFTGLLTGDGQSLWSVKVESWFHGRSVGELAEHLRQRHQALLIALYTEGTALSLEELISDEPSPINEFIQRKFAETGMTHLFGRTKVEFQINPPDTYILGPHQYAVVIAAHQPSL